jgi:hypothetical protein
VDRLPLGRVDHLSAIRPAKVDRLPGGSGDLVEHGTGARQRGVAIEVHRPDDEGVEAELVDAAIRVNLQPAPVDHRPQNGVQTALGDAQPDRQLHLRALAVCSEFVEKV